MNSSNEQLITAFKTLADPIRLRIVNLCSASECAVSELTDVLRISQPRASQHVKALCDAGLLTRFRDGQFVYYRAASRGDGGQLRRRLMDLVAEEDVFGTDRARLQALRSNDVDESTDRFASQEDRTLYRYLIDLSVASPLGDLLDIGCGRGDVLKLLASRAQRAVGVDIDPAARRLARAELLTAGVPNCSLRRGDMYALPFEDREFDTVILDDTLHDADDPVAALNEAARLLRSNGRLVILSRAGGSAPTATELARLCADTGLRLFRPRAIPAVDPQWLFATATLAETTGRAA